MNSKGKLYWAKVAVVMGAIPLVIWAYETGPDAGYYGVPGENGTCTAAGCHTGTTNNPANKGSVTVNFPNGLMYAPGVVQHLSVTIADPAATQTAWGFQLTARTSNPGTQAGTFASLDSYTGLECAQVGNVNNESSVLSLPTPQVCPANMGLQYIEHNDAGYLHTMGPGSGTYQFNWTPPATNVGNITIYVAGNAGVGGEPNANGDHIYATFFTLTPAAAGPPPAITAVVTTSSQAAYISQNTWIEIHGSNLAQTTTTWSSLPASDFTTNLPTSLGGVSATVNGKAGAVFYVSPTQVNVLAPLDSATGTVPLQLTTNGQSVTQTVTEVQTSPAFLVIDTAGHIAARHLDYSLLGPASLSSPGYTFTPAKVGELVLLYATGFGQTSPPITNQLTGLGSLPTLPTVLIGDIPATVASAGLSAAGLYQFNVTVPPGVPSGDASLSASYNGGSTQSNVVITVQ